MSAERIDITEEEFIARVNRVDQVRQFFIRMWLENPELLKDGDPKLVEMMKMVREQNAALARTASPQV